MKFETIIVTTKPFELNGENMCFSNEDLLRLADTAVGVPITVDFKATKQIGIITKAKVIDGNLVCELDINNKPFGNEPSYIVPGTMYEAQTKHHTKLIECAITRNPAQVLPPL